MVETIQHKKIVIKKKNISKHFVENCDITPASSSLVLGLQFQLQYLETLYERVFVKFICKDARNVSSIDHSLRKTIRAMLETNSHFYNNILWLISAEIYSMLAFTSAVSANHEIKLNL